LTANLLCEFGSPCQQTRNSLTHGSQRPEGGTVGAHNPCRLGAKACLSYKTLGWVGHPRLRPPSSSDDLHYNHHGRKEGRKELALPKAHLKFHSDHYNLVRKFLTHANDRSHASKSEWTSFRSQRSSCRLYLYQPSHALLLDAFSAFD